MKLYIKCSVINTHTTGTSYYDAFLDPSLTEYLEKNKNLAGHIEYMSPAKYFRECAKIFGTTVESLKAQRKRDKSSITYLTDVIQSGESFKLPYINYANCGQEGLHRMMVLGDMYGWDKEYPVLVVDYVDKRKQELDDIYNELRKCVSSALEYSYPADKVDGYLSEQISYELSRIEPDIIITFRKVGSKYVVGVKGIPSDEISIEIDIGDIRIRESSDDDMSIDDLLDTEDLDLDDLITW